MDVQKLSRRRRLLQSAMLLAPLHAAGGMLLADDPLHDPSTPEAAAIASPSHLSRRSDFGLSVEGAHLLYGPIDGYVQTPAGGQPGTSSEGRPTLDELGIDTATSLDAELALGDGTHEIFAGAQMIRLTGDATLQQPLISQSYSFPAGSVVSSDIQLDVYRFGLRRRFLVDLDSDRSGPELAIAPSVGAGLFSFHYQLDSPGIENVDRSYSKPMPLLGLDAEWAISDRFALVGRLLAAPPIPDTPFIFSAQLLGQYHLVKSHNIDVDLSAGIGYQHIQYDDGKKQTLPNDIDINFGPQLIFGLSAEF